MSQMVEIQTDFHKAGYFLADIQILHCNHIDFASVTNDFNIELLKRLGSNLQLSPTLSYVHVALTITIIHIRDRRQISLLILSEFKRIPLHFL